MKFMEILKKISDRMKMIDMSRALHTQLLKQVQTILVKSYIRTYKLKAVISNCCNNYGPYQFPEKLIPKIISNIFNNKELPIYGKEKTQENGYM